jgi:hypothetical protein
VKESECKNLVIICTTLSMNDHRRSDRHRFGLIVIQKKKQKKKKQKINNSNIISSHK